jgi:hypothetical protein
MAVMASEGGTSEVAKCRSGALEVESTWSGCQCDVGRRGLL